jgi:DNA-binding NarL/FixJ family response regulator
LLAAQGDLEGARAALQEALAAHERLPMPFERARTLLTIGQVERRSKQKARATASLSEALAVFDRLGATIWSGRAKAELGRVGLRPRATADLTSTEQQVAELAAAGLSSREIGERVFLTPKTVGNVLGRVYQKLGIHSRAELGARMGQGRPPDRSG